jgi:hypothetical protein
MGDSVAISSRDCTVRSTHLSVISVTWISCGVVVLTENYLIVAYDRSCQERYSWRLQISIRNGASQYLPTIPSILDSILSFSIIRYMRCDTAQWTHSSHSLARGCTHILEIKHCTAKQKSKWEPLLLPPRVFLGMDHLMGIKQVILPFLRSIWRRQYIELRRGVALIIRIEISLISL